MSKNLLIIIISFMSLAFILPVQAQHPAEQKKKVPLEQKLISIERKIKDLEGKVNQIKSNQEIILSEINICKVRARR